MRAGTVRNPNDPESYRSLGSLWIKLGDPLVALAALEQGARSNPKWMNDATAGYRFRWAVRAAFGPTKTSPPESDVRSPRDRTARELAPPPRPVK